MPALVKHKVFQTNDPPQVLMLLMDRMDWLLEHCQDEASRSYVLPVLYRALGMEPLLSI